MNGLSLAIGLLQLVMAVYNWMVRNGYIKAGGEAAFAKILKGQSDDLERKVAAMAAADKRFTDAGAGKLPSDFKTRD